MEASTKSIFPPCKPISHYRERLVLIIITIAQHNRLTRTANLRLNHSLQRWEGSQEVRGALVASGVMVQILLMIILSIPPAPRGRDLGHDAALVPLLVGLLRHLARHPLLLLAVVVDGAPVLRARVRALPVRRRRVVQPVEELEDLAVGDLRRVVVQLQAFGVCGGLLGPCV